VDAHAAPVQFHAQLVQRQIPDLRHPLAQEVDVR
jgi:hypothetical protein